MNITLTARKFSASDHLKMHTDTQVRKLEKFFDRIIDCEVILEESNSTQTPQTAELILKVPGSILHARESALYYESAVTAVVDNMKSQLLKYKSKLRD